LRIRGYERQEQAREDGPENKGEENTESDEAFADKFRVMIVCH
jgi:hypothetical protein